MIRVVCVLVVAFISVQVVFAQEQNADGNSTTSEIQISLDNLIQTKLDEYMKLQNTLFEKQDDALETAILWTNNLINEMIIKLSGIKTELAKTCLNGLIKNSKNANNLARNEIQNCTKEDLDFIDMIVGQLIRRKGMQLPSEPEEMQKLSKIVEAYQGAEWVIPRHKNCTEQSIFNLNITLTSAREYCTFEEDDFFYIK